MRKRFDIVNQRLGARLAAAHVADAPLSRIVGLLGRRALEPGTGLLIVPCRAIHTCFMRFAIDVAFLDRDGCVVRAVPDVRPFRVTSGGRGAWSALELPSGTLEATGTQPGDRLRYEPR